ncbi:hypothetical protein NEF87_000487 [Candidatus Lokiarchaeum ossiferum]|uniref:Uncharacterized protein n=1 Tax=Candidatus Lokiarchaeum ossiferum TaxID=2951803 RepID=A0ABY6HMU1_9ARCH|nr:hypothetical protein NEF87_000487 [Candidatus Lokiarchaeum sp. B-35]
MTRIFPHIFGSINEKGVVFLVEEAFTLHLLYGVDVLPPIYFEEDPSQMVFIQIIAGL